MRLNCVSKVNGVIIPNSSFGKASREEARSMGGG